MNHPRMDLLPGRAHRRHHLTFVSPVHPHGRLGESSSCRARQTVRYSSGRNDSQSNTSSANEAHVMIWPITNTSSTDDGLSSGESERASGGNRIAIPSNR